MGIVAHFWTFQMNEVISKGAFDRLSSFGGVKMSADFRLILADPCTAACRVSKHPGTEQGFLKPFAEKLEDVGCVSDPGQYSCIELSMHTSQIKVVMHGWNDKYLARCFTVEQ